eukprot:11027-Heterococcus_DN1.PRE.1
MLTAYGEGGQWKKAEELFADVLHSRSAEPTLVTFNVMITAYGNGKQWQKAEQMFTDVLQSDALQPNVITYNAMITAYCSSGKWQEALALLDKLKEASGLQPNLATYRALIDALQAAEQIDTADKLYREAVAADLVYHWRPKAQVSELRVIKHTAGLALAALRLVLHNMHTTATSSSSSSSSSSASSSSSGACSGSDGAAAAVVHSDIRVHDVTQDLHIVVGTGAPGDAKRSKSLRRSVTVMLKQLGITCTVSDKDKYRLVVPASDTLQYCALESSSSSSE